MGDVVNTIILGALFVDLLCAIEQATFFQYTSPNMGVYPVDGGFYNKVSLANCGVLCWSRHKSFYFLYDKHATSCTCALTLMENQPLPGVHQALYVHSQAKACPMADGYVLEGEGDTVVCLMAKYQDHEGYTRASLFCNAKGSRLFLTDTTDKLQIYSRLGAIYGQSYLLGAAHYMSSEGDFVWSDGRTMSDEEKSTVFLTGHPNNDRGHKGCVVFITSSAKFVDHNCDPSCGYTCEKLLTP